MYTKEEHDKASRLLQNSVGTLNSFQQHIKNKFSDSSKANKLIELGKKIGKINFLFKQNFQSIFKNLLKKTNVITLRQFLRVVSNQKKDEK